MATFFKNKLEAGLGTTETTVLSTASNARTTVIGMSLTNMTPDLVLASVKISDTTVPSSAYYIRNVVIPAHESLRVVNGGEKLVLGPSTDVLIEASVDSSLDLVMSYVEII